MNNNNDEDANAMMVNVNDDEERGGDDPNDDDLSYNDKRPTDSSGVVSPCKRSTQQVDGELADLTARFAAAKSDKSRCQALYKELQAWFDGLFVDMGLHDVAAIIADFLRSGLDAETGAPFTVGRSSLEKANCCGSICSIECFSLIRRKPWCFPARF